MLTEILFKKFKTAIKNQFKDVIIKDVLIIFDFEKMNAKKGYIITDKGQRIEINLNELL